MKAKRRVKKPKKEKMLVAGNIINDTMIKDGNDVMILGMMKKPIQSHPNYSALVGYVNRMTASYTQAIELAGKALGMKIHIKTFLKAYEEDTNVSV